MNIYANILTSNRHATAVRSKRLFSGLCLSLCYLIKNRICRSSQHPIVLHTLGNLFCARLVFLSNFAYIHHRRTGCWLNILNNGFWHFTNHECVAFFCTGKRGIPLCSIPTGVAVKIAAIDSNRTFRSIGRTRSCLHPSKMTVALDLQLMLLCIRAVIQNYPVDGSRVALVKSNRYPRVR